MQKWFNDFLVTDMRFQNKNYLLLAIVYPKQLEKAFLFLRDNIKKIVGKYINAEISVSDITNDKLLYLHEELETLIRKLPTKVE